MARTMVCLRPLRTSVLVGWFPVVLHHQPVDEITVRVVRVGAAQALVGEGATGAVGEQRLEFAALLWAEVTVGLDGEAADGGAASTAGARLFVFVAEASADPANLLARAR